MHRAKLKSDKCFKPFQINFIQHSRSLIKQNLILFFVGIDNVEKTFSGPASLSTLNKHLFFGIPWPQKIQNTSHFDILKSSYKLFKKWSLLLKWTKLRNMWQLYKRNSYPFIRVLKWQIMGPFLSGKNIFITLYRYYILI